MDDAGDTTTHKALRVVLNEKTNEAIKQMQKDSEELASLKKQLPLLSQLSALSEKDINNHQTGKLLFHDEDTYDGSNSESLAAHLEDVVQALGTVDGINLAGAGITAFDL